MKIDYRTGARAGAQDYRNKAEVWSGPVALFASCVVSSFRMSLVEMSSGGIKGKALSGMSGCGHRETLI